MKKTITRLFLFTGVVLALCGCSTMSPSDTLVVNKANEYLRTGVTRDPDEAVQMARQFYREGALQMEAAQKNQDMNAAVKDQQEKQRQLESGSATKAPR